MTTLTIAHHNSRSINNKLAEIDYYLHQYNIDILTINETLKIKSNSKIEGYKISKPDNNKGRGVGIIHKENLKIIEEEQATSSNKTTNLNHTITVITPTENIRISTIYCPKGKPDMEIFESIASHNNNTIITGDWNSKHTEWEHTKNEKGGTGIINIMDKYNYIKLNDGTPTYTNDVTGKQDIKDLMYSSPQLYQRFETFAVKDDLGSDHNLIISQFKTEKLTHPEQPRTVKLYHKANWDNINDNITKRMNKHTLTQTSTTKDCDTHISNLHIILNEELETGVKTQTISKKSVGMSKELIDMIKLKRKHRKMYKKTNNIIHKEQ